MAPVKRTPLRKCTGCGQMKPKKEMVRVVKTPTGDLLVDHTGKQAGRGAYVCINDVACLAAARKARRLEKAFACRIPDEVYAELEALQTNGNG